MSNLKGLLIMGDGSRMWPTARSTGSTTTCTYLFYLGAEASLLIASFDSTCHLQLPVPSSFDCDGEPALVLLDT